jgi:hypothetical protein
MEPREVAPCSHSMAISLVRSAKRHWISQYLLLHASAGVGVGFLIGSGLLLTNALGLGQLILSSADPGLVAILILGAITTMAPLVFATAVGMLAGANDARGR